MVGPKLGGILGKILGGASTKVIDAAGEIIDRVVTTDAERLQARKELLEVERQWNADLLKADQEFAKAQSEVIIAEAKGESWMQRNWRPILMLAFTYIVVHNFVLAPTLSIPRVEIPTDMWELLKLGVGGYVMGRSAEKVSETVTPAIAEALKSRGKTK